MPHPTSIAWMLGPPGPQPDSSWRDSRMAYRRKPGAFGISVGGGAAMSRNAPTAACRSFYTWARSSLARSVDQRISASAAAAMVQQRPKLPLEFLFISSMPRYNTRYVTFFDVFKVVSKVSMTTTLHLDKDLSPGTAPPIKEGTFGHRNSVSSRTLGRLAARPAACSGRAPHVLMVVEDPLEKGEREKSVRGRDVDPNAIEREPANETSI